MIEYRKNSIDNSKIIRDINNKLNKFETFIVNVKFVIFKLPLHELSLNKSCVLKTRNADQSIINHKSLIHIVHFIKYNNIKSLMLYIKFSVFIYLDF